MRVHDYRHEKTANKGFFEAELFLTNPMQIIIMILKHPALICGVFFVAHFIINNN